MLSPRRWTVLIFVATIAAISLLTRVYLDTYRRPQQRTLERLLKRYYAGPAMGNNDPNDGDVVARRDKILRLRESMGVSIDSLPIVRFEASDDPNANVEDGDDGEEGEIRARRQECLTTGYYLSGEDDYANCRSVCGVSDGVEYRYYDKLGAMLNGRKGRIGAYCMPTDAAVCNTNTSLALYTKHGWRCVPQTRAFAGEGGNRIIVCDGSLLDRATGRVWRDHIDPTLTFASIDEKLPDGSGDYRFVCPPNITDSVGNDMIPAPFDRLLLLRNVCAIMIPNAQTDLIYPDFEKGRCQCASRAPSEYDEKLGLPFDSEDSEFRRKSLEQRIASQPVPCIQTWSTISDMEIILDREWRSSALMPCGGESDGENTASYDSSMPACDKTYAMLYYEKVPSPYMMLAGSSQIRNLKLAAAAAADVEQ